MSSTFLSILYIYFLSISIYPIVFCADSCPSFAGLNAPVHCERQGLAGNDFGVTQGVRQAWALGQIEQGQPGPPAGLAAAE